jgi:hypothetical protein
LLPAPERHHQAAGLEEDDIVLGHRPGRPAELLVEAPGPAEAADAEGDQADTLRHGRR